MFARQQHPEIGARPGTLAIPPDSPAPTIKVVHYDAGAVEEYELADTSDLGKLRSLEKKAWIDVQGLGDETVLRDLASAFDLHPLALEDAVNVPQRPKTDLYQHHQLVIARAPWHDEDGALRHPQVCFVVGKDYVLTFQKRYYGFFENVRERIRDGLGPLRRSGSDYLAYALIDSMVDRYYPVVQQLAESLEELEDLAFDNPHPSVMARIHLLRRQLVRLRRIAWPQREAIHAMLREHTDFVGEGVLLYLRDTYGHIAQIVELIDASREMASDLAEAFLSNVSHRTNEIMKVLTLMASVFIPLTFIAGIYGMNFEHMPELQLRNGYFFALGAMALMGIGMTAYFVRRGWIGAPAPPDLGSPSDLFEDK